MPFTGLSTAPMFTASNIGEDVTPTIRLISPIEVPYLDWVGDSDVVATSTKHEFLEDEFRPNQVVTAGAIASATANTGVQLADFGDLLTVGTILENRSAAPEILRVASIAGATSILLTRATDGGAVGSLASGGTLYVRAGYGLEGDDHPNRDVSRPRRRKQTTVGLFHIPVAISGTQLAVDVLGGVTNEMEHQVNRRLVEALRDLEKECLHGTFVNSTMTASTYRGIRGLRAEVTSINSTVTAASFTADPHLYIGDAYENCFAAGADPSEDWGIVAGRGIFRDISNMNANKVQDTSRETQFTRVIRDYAGPFGAATVILSRWLDSREMYLVPRNRVKVFPLQNRNFHVQTMGKTGDNEKRLVVGEYGQELHHAYAMARLRA